MNFKIIRIIVIMALLWALADNPYAYYQILRWVVCGVTGYGSFLAYNEKRNEWAWIFGIIAVLFNPIVPFYLTREIWTVIDLIVAAFVIASIYFFKIQPEKKL